MVFEVRSEDGVWFDVMRVRYHVSLFHLEQRDAEQNACQYPSGVTLLIRGIGIQKDVGGLGGSTQTEGGEVRTSR